MKRFYGVKVGKRCGIFTCLDSLKESVLNYPGAEYKGFNTRHEVVEYLDSCPIDVNEYLIEEIEPISHNNKDTLVAYIDGSYSKELTTEYYGCGVVLIHSNKQQEHYSIRGKEGIELTNIAGELKAAEFCFNKAIEYGYKKLILHYDYVGVKNCAINANVAKNKHTKEYRDNYEMNIKPYLDVQFVKVKSHSKLLFNDTADYLAKKAIKDII
jgi:ribonuclease HI